MFSRSGSRDFLEISSSSARVFTFSRTDGISADEKKLAAQNLGVNLEQFKKFNAKRKFKAAVSTVVAANKLASLGLDFKKNL